MLHKEFSSMRSLEVRVPNWNSVRDEVGRIAAASVTLRPKSGMDELAQRPLLQQTHVFCVSVCVHVCVRMCVCVWMCVCVCARTRVSHLLGGGRANSMCINL